MSRPITRPFGANSLRREEAVQPGARPQVEYRFAFSQAGDRPGIPATVRGDRLRQIRSFYALVQPLADLVSSRAATGRAGLRPLAVVFLHRALDLFGCPRHLGPLLSVESIAYFRYPGAKRDAR